MVSSVTRLVIDNLVKGFKRGLKERVLFLKTKKTTTTVKQMVILELHKRK